MSMYWILFIGIAIISYIVQASLQSKFKKYSKMPLSNGMTGKEVAAQFENLGELVKNTIFVA